MSVCAPAETGLLMLARAVERIEAPAGAAAGGCSSSGAAVDAAVDLGETADELVVFVGEIVAAGEAAVVGTVERPVEARGGEVQQLAWPHEDCISAGWACRHNPHSGQVVDGELVAWARSWTWVVVFRLGSSIVKSGRAVGASNAVVERCRWAWAVRPMLQVV